jgi:hypothetical protein
MSRFQHVCDELFAAACAANKQRQYKWHKNLKVAEDELAQVAHHTSISLRLISSIESEHLDLEAQVQRLQSVLQKFAPFVQRVGCNLPNIRDELGMPPSASTAMQGGVIAPSDVASAFPMLQNSSNDSSNSSSNDSSNSSSNDSGGADSKAGGTLVLVEMKAVEAGGRAKVVEEEEGAAEAKAEKSRFKFKGQDGSVAAEAKAEAKDGGPDVVQGVLVTRKESKGESKGEELKQGGAGRQEEPSDAAESGGSLICVVS